jgi:phosphoglycerate dehydrogenase-like enzyme
MFDKNQFEMMKSDSILINTSRGSIVNTHALNEALNKGHIGGAGLDVFEEEPIKPDSPLLKNPKIILTPHMSWLSVESVRYIRESYMDDLQRFINGQGPKDQVNPKIKIRVN